MERERLTRLIGNHGGSWDWQQGRETVDTCSPFQKCSVRYGRSCAFSWPDFCTSKGWVILPRWELSGTHLRCHIPLSLPYPLLLWGILAERANGGFCQPALPAKIPDKDPRSSGRQSWPGLQLHEVGPNLLPGAPTYRGAPDFYLRV